MTDPLSVAASLARPLASNSARLNFTLSPHNFHALVESCGHNRHGYIAWGIGDASIGHFPGHQRRLVAPPLSTGAALYARPGAEVVRASRPISPSEWNLPVGLARAVMKRRGGGGGGPVQNFPPLLRGGGV